MANLRIRSIAIVALVLAFAGCMAGRAIDERTTQGPTAREIWFYRVASQNGREPTFDERQHWETQLDTAISGFLNDHPDVANAYDVSTFRHARRVTVGMLREQVLILLGRPDATSTDTAQMEKDAGKFWPDIKEKATEMWSYPLGWRLYFEGPRVIDITQRLPRA